jgi:predicted transglutaminase-like cysteine proteinase
MVLGEAAHAPAGFLDYCERAPLQCAQGREERPGEEAQAQTIRIEARRQMWAAVFNLDAPVPASGRAAESPTSAPAAGPGPDLPAALEPAADSGPLPDEAAPAWRAGLDPVAPVAVSPLTVDTFPAPAPGAPLPMTPRLWAELNAINERVNRAIVYREDIELYGVEDYWNTPLEAGLRYGDCEDYVLEKRRALVAGGVPAAALSIAIVANPGGGPEHALLLVATDKGEYALDNQTTWILPWNKTRYRWEERQRPNTVFDWVKIATALAPRSLSRASR